MLIFSISNAKSNIALFDSLVSHTNYYGGYTELNFNIHSVDFKSLPGYPLCCPHFKNGFGVGASLGVFGEFDLYEDYNLQVRMGYSNVSGLLKTVEPQTFGIDGKPMYGKFQYAIDAGLSYFGLSTLAKKEIYDNTNLLAGFNIGLISGNSFEQKEEIIESKDAIFKETNSKIRNHYTGNIPNTSSIIFSIEAGINYVFPMNKEKTFFIAPEIFLSYGLNSYNANLPWHIFSPKIGLSIFYKPSHKKTLETIYEEKRLIDTIKKESPFITKKIFKKGLDFVIVDSVFDANTMVKKIKKTSKRIDTLLLPRDYKLFGKIRAVGIEDSVEKPIATMQIKEISFFSMQPLLNYIFFGKNSARIPDRYILLPKDKVKDFSFKKIYNLKTLPTYYNLLNIIGKRMQMYKKAKLNVVGCNSNTGKETNNLELSRARAKAVINYLTDNWDIDSNRISLNVRNLPEMPSNINSSDGVQENRRVEIYSDNYEITAPVFVNDTMRESTPADIRFYPEVISEAKLKNWEVQAKQRNIVFKKFEGKDSIPKYLDWHLNIEQSTVPRFNEPLEYSLQLKNIYNKTFTTKTQTLPLNLTKIKDSKNRVGDKKIEHFSLILYNYEETSLTKQNKRIKDYIKKRIKKNSKVTIIGYTDRFGFVNMNQALSERRAKTLAKALNVPLENAKGVGEKYLLYDNSLPEGRFYCRTVEVEVETSIEK